MSVHTDPYYALNFYQCLKGLYYFDTSALNILNILVNTYYLLNTIQENKKIFNRSEIEGEDAARILQRAIIFPSITKFKPYIKATNSKIFP